MVINVSKGMGKAMLTLSLNSKLIQALTLIGSGTFLATTFGLAEAKAQDATAIVLFNEREMGSGILVRTKPMNSTFFQRQL
jgi:hypothetical protein